jgi:uncharacterized small protein (DUF1192 family)
MTDHAIAEAMIAAADHDKRIAVLEDEVARLGQKFDALIAILEDHVAGR